MNDLIKVSQIVKAVLEDDMQSRNSDSHLYLKVLDYIAHRDGIFLSGMPVPYFLENMKDLGFPPFESVRRTRQKIQAECPHLAACDKVKAMRDEQEAEFWAFATGKGVHP